MAADPTTADGVRAIITGLRLGLASYVSGTTFQDRGVTYRSTDEILQAITYFEGLLARIVGRSKKQTLVVGQKGFNPPRCF
jgi:hypothetical protein